MSTRVARGPDLHALPVAIHGPRTTRLSDAELLRFEAVLETADEAVEAYVEARTPQRLPASDSEAVALLRALVDVVVATTGVSPPSAMDNRRELVRWAMDSIVDARTHAVHQATRKNLAPGMDPQHLATCMDLVAKLNGVIGA